MNMKLPTNYLPMLSRACMVVATAIVVATVVSSHNAESRANRNERLVKNFAEYLRENSKTAKTPVDRMTCVLEATSEFLESYGRPDLARMVQHLNVSKLQSDGEIKYNVTGLIASYGYPVEEHEVHTDDGYILTLYRIPHGIVNKTNGPREVVFLQHGLLASASNWISNLPSEGLGYILADAGYDVWMGNSRGNTYSKKHETLNSSEKAFWEWSWDEMAKYDLPSSLNYTLNYTKQEQLYYIAHSQGTMIAFAEFSRNQELAKKVKMFFAMGPVATVGYITSPLFRFLADDLPDSVLTGLLVDLHLYDFLPSIPLIHALGDTVCAWPETRFLCEYVIGMFGGYSHDHMNATRLPLYVHFCPAGTSEWNMDHWSQMVESKKCCMYDYGKKGNMNHYNQSSPPEYRIEDMQTPVALFHGGRDTLADPKDVGLLIPRLQNLFYNKYIPNYGHLDFIWAVDAKDYCYKDIIGLITKGLSKT